jgi:hypothetical protein
MDRNFTAECVCTCTLNFWRTQQKANALPAISQRFASVYFECRHMLTYVVKFCACSKLFSDPDPSATFVDAWTVGQRTRGEPMCISRQSDRYVSDSGQEVIYARAYLLNCPLGRQTTRPLWIEGKFLRVQPSPWPWEYYATRGPRCVFFSFVPNKKGWKMYKCDRLTVGLYVQNSY